MSKIDLDYVKELEVYRDLYFKQQDQIQKMKEGLKWALHRLDNADMWNKDDADRFVKYKKLLLKP
jgi:hypothetical protein